MSRDVFSGADWMVLALIAVLASPAAAQEATPQPADAGSGSAAAPEAPLTPEQTEAIARALDFDARTLTASGPVRSLTRRRPRPDALAISGSDRPDGSSTIAIKRSLPASWDAKVGVDLSTAATPTVTYDPNKPLPGGDRNSSGAAWASVGVNKFTTVDARVDAGNESGRLGTTLEHSIAVGDRMSLTLRGNYAVSQTGASASPSPDPSFMTLPQSANAAAAQEPVWSGEQAVKLNVQPTGTTFSAGVNSTSTDPVTHNRLSAEQKVYGPLHVTTSINDIGEATSSKSVTAGFRLTW